MAAHRSAAPARGAVGSRTAWSAGAAGVGAAVLIAAAAAAHRAEPSAPVSPLPGVPAAAAAPPAPEKGLELAVRSGPPDRGLPPPAASADLVVSVIGLVDHPGLLHVAPGARVADAVAIAVVRDGSDLTGLNLAQRLADGDQIVVATAAPASVPRLGSMVVSSGPHGAAASGTPAAPPQRININTATEKDLDTLTGVGPSTATAIITWRNQHGRFTSADQLADVTGIGPAKLDRLRDQVTVWTPAAVRRTWSGTLRRAAREDRTRCGTDGHTEVDARLLPAAPARWTVTVLAVLAGWSIRCGSRCGAGGFECRTRVGPGSRTRPRGLPGYRLDGVGGVRGGDRIRLRGGWQDYRVGADPLPRLPAGSVVTADLSPAIRSPCLPGPSAAGSG